MEYQTLKLSRDEGIAVLTLARPPVNALGRQLVEELGEVLKALEADDSLRSLIVAAEGKAFCAGADLKERQNMSEDDVRRWVPFLGGTFTVLAELPAPTIAVIHGAALGGGVELALACDFRIAETGATLGLRETALAIIPGAGGTQRLPRLIGPARAKEMTWTGRHVRADEALAIGLVDRVVPLDSYLDAALGWAASFASGAVVSMGLAKRAINGGLDGPLSEGLDLERTLFGQVLATEDAATGIQSFFDHGPGKATFVGR